MKLTKEEMMASIVHHTANKVPNWPPELVKDILKVIEQYPHDSYETLITSVYSPMASKAIKRPTRQYFKRVLQGHE